MGPSRATETSLFAALNLGQPSGDFSPDERSKACGLYYGLGLGLALWLDSWHYQGNRQWKAANLCDQSENNKPSLMEGWYLSPQAELQVAWMVPTGPPLTNLQVAIYTDSGAECLGRLSDLELGIF